MILDHLLTNVELRCNHDVTGNQGAQLVLDATSPLPPNAPMNREKSICVYCGSSPGADPAFAAAALELGRAIAGAGHRLVYGGGNVGLMGITAHAVLNAGGAVTGIIPDFLKRHENMLEGVDELIVTQDMHERKMLMFDKSDAFVALPGGIGTLEELVEQLTWAQLGRHTKPIVVANVGGFWDPLSDLFAHMNSQAFLRQDTDLQFQSIDRVTDIVPHIESLWQISMPDEAEDQAILERF